MSGLKMQVILTSPQRMTRDDGQPTLFAVQASAVLLPADTALGIHLDLFPCTQQHW